MPQPTICAELVRRLRDRPPAAAVDYRDPKLPGFVLRARPSGVHSWRVQLASRRWLTLGRLEEVSLADARMAAQVRRVQAALGETIPRRKPASEVTLRKFLDETYEPWMKATYGKRTGKSNGFDPGSEICVLAVRRELLMTTFPPPGVRRFTCRTPSVVARAERRSQSRVFVGGKIANSGVLVRGPCFILASGIVSTTRHSVARFSAARKAAMLLL